MPFLKDFLINNSTKVILWKIIPGELSDKHLNEDDKKLLKITSKRNKLDSRTLFNRMWLRDSIVADQSGSQVASILMLNKFCFKSFPQKCLYMMPPAHHFCY